MNGGQWGGSVVRRPLAAMPDNLSSVPGSHMVEGVDLFPQAVPDLHTCTTAPRRPLYPKHKQMQ